MGGADDAADATDAGIDVAIGCGVFSHDDVMKKHATSNNELVFCRLNVIAPRSDHRFWFASARTNARATRRHPRDGRSLYRAPLRFSIAVLRSWYNKLPVND